MMNGPQYGSQELSNGVASSSDFLSHNYERNSLSPSTDHTKPSFCSSFPGVPAQSMPVAMNGPLKQEQIVSSTLSPPFGAFSAVRQPALYPGFQNGTFTPHCTVAQPSYGMFPSPNYPQFSQPSNADIAGNFPPSTSSPFQRFVSQSAAVGDSGRTFVSHSTFAGGRLPPPPHNDQHFDQPPQVDSRSFLQSPLDGGREVPFSEGLKMPPMPPLPTVGHGTGTTGNLSGFRPPSVPVSAVTSLPSRSAAGPGLPPMPGPPGLIDDFRRMGLQQSTEGRTVDLLADRHILPPRPPSPLEIRLPRSVENPNVNCDPSIFRCTLGAVPQTQDLLKKSRLPLGLVLHPFKDMKSLTILQVSIIVRCRACRTYINPFVSFTDSRHWKCNVCYRINDLPDDFSWDPVTKSFGEPQRRPEIRYATIEFLAPQEYMLRPPQPAVYLYVLDVSANAIETGYLGVFCERLLAKLDSLPGDRKMLIGFIAVDSGVHFYEFAEGSVEAKEMVVTDLDDMFIPSYNGLLVNLHENKETIREFIQNFPSLFEANTDSHNALGAAVKAAQQLVADIGGRITVMQTILPDVGPGSLTSREDPNLRSSNDVRNLGPATDFYKCLALECSGHQIAVDLFLLSSHYADLATLSGMSKYCGGCIYHYPGIHLLRNTLEMKRFERDLTRYLTRKIGFEAVLRIRCTKGLSLHTFHGNFFVRSTDLLALPNVNPDSAMGVRVEMEENLTDVDQACFQAALLYTSSRGDRRIRVHTLCLPVANSLSEIHSKADVEAVMSLLAKLAVEKSINSSLTDAREALVNAVIDAFSSVAHSFPGSQGAGLLAPPGTLRFMPLYLLGLLKNTAFSFGASIKLDRRFYAMCQFQTMPLTTTMREIYPDLYPLHIIDIQEDEFTPPRFQLSYEKIDRHGVYLMDTGTYFYVYIGQAISDEFCRQLFGVQTFSQIDEDVEDLPELETPVSVKLRSFISNLRSNRSFYSPLRILREDSAARELFIRRLVDDRSESSHSYVEFLQHIKREVSPR